MKKKDILFGIFIFAILIFSLSSIARIQAVDGSAVSCQQLYPLLKNDVASACATSPQYCCWAKHGCNSPLCSGNGNENNGDTPTKPVHTEQDTLNELENGLNEAYNTNEEEQNYNFDDLDNSHKTKAQHWFDDDAAFYENWAEQNGKEKYSLLLNGIKALKERVGQEGLPPEVRAKELSIPFTGRTGSYKAEISTHGYPELDWMAQNPKFITLTLWHGEDGMIRYYYEDDTESVYSDTQKPIPFEGFGVHQGEEIAMPKLATYAGKSGITASADNLDWGEITFKTVYDGITTLQTLHPTIKVNEDADVGMKNFYVTIKDKNGNTIDSILLTADIQPKNGGGYIDYADESTKKFSRGMGYFFLAIGIFFVGAIVWAILRDKKKIKDLRNSKNKKEELIKFKKNRIYLIMGAIGMAISIYGFYKIFSFGSNFWIGFLLLIVGGVIATIGMSKYSPKKMKRSEE